MAANLSVRQIALEALCCFVLGGTAGAVRALAPAKGRAAVLPDFLLVGVLAVLLQSYAAGVSFAFELRWYMAVSAALGAAAAHRLFDLPAGFARRAAKGAAIKIASFLRLKLLLPLAEKRRGRRERLKARKYEKTAAKKREKLLQNGGQLLYNSNI